jgi:regulator of sigma E protease
MEIVIKILQLLLSLSILVIVHEFGHFMAAKAFKTRVEKFYLFFNPWFSLYKFNFKGTEYGIGWLPLGGYVKIAGMIDESMDTEAMKQPAQEWEFRSKPAWQRLIIMLGGVIMNVVLAFAIYIGMLTSYGEKYLSTSEVNRYGISVDSLAMEFGLKNGDRILSVDGKYIEDFSKIPLAMILDDVKTIQVERGGQKLNITLPEGAISKLVKEKTPYFISIRIPFIVDGFASNSVAEKAGILVGDSLLGINGINTRYSQEFRENIQKYKNQDVTIDVKRGLDTLHFALTVPAEGLIGVAPQQLDNFFKQSQRKYSFFQAIPAGVEKAIFSNEGIVGYWKQLKLLVNPEMKAYESVGGFITIGKIFPAQFEWQRFWQLTAFLSIMLAVLNVLPIPALDGGHVVFLFYEIITRRKPSDKFLEVAQIIGMVLLFGLLIFANGNDIVKLFK